MTLTLNPECGRAAMRRICASLPRQRTAAGDTPGRPIVRIFCHILPFIFLSLIAFFDNLNEYKKRMNDNNKQPNSHGGDNMDFRPIRTRLVASSPSFLLSFHSAATTLVKAFRCVCVCVASSCRCCQPALPLPSSKSRPVFKKRKGAAPAFQYIHYDGPTQCFTKAFVDSIHHSRVYCAIPIARQHLQKTIIPCVLYNSPLFFFSFFAIRHIIDYGWCLV